MNDRDITKNEMVQERKGKCDLCAADGTDMHELIPRSRTRKGSLARELSYRKPICSLLCRKCHSKAHNHITRQVLLGMNAGRYGRREVEQALDDVRNNMRGDHRVYLEITDG